MRPHQTKLVHFVDVPKLFNDIQYQKSLQVSTIRTVRSTSRDRIRNMQFHRTTWYCVQSRCFVQIPVNNQVCFVWEIRAEIVSQFWTVVSYRTPSGTGTGTATVMPWSPAVCREESTAIWDNKAVSAHGLDEALWRMNLMASLAALFCDSVSARPRYFSRASIASGPA